MAKPVRTFDAHTDEVSVGNAGPDKLKEDLDNAFSMFDPNSVLSDGTTPGGISQENLQPGVIPTDADTVDGHHASEFALASHRHGTLSGQVDLDSQEFSSYITHNLNNQYPLVAAYQYDSATGLWITDGASAVEYTDANRCRIKNCYTSGGVRKFLYTVSLA